MKKIFITILSCCLLVACKVNTDLQQPAIPKTAAYSDADNLLTPEQHVELGNKLTSEWWTLFASESLNNIIQQALQNNYDLKTARSNLLQAEEAVKSARANYWPQVTLDANAGREKFGIAEFGSFPAHIPPFDYYELGPSLSWTLDLFGATQYSVEYQQALVCYQARSLDAAYIMVTSNVVTQALEIAAVNEEISATSKLIAEDQKILDLMQTKFSIGSANKLEILEAQNTLEDDKAKLPALQQRLKVAKHALAILIGKPPVEWEAPDFVLNDFALPHTLPVSLPSELVQKRPDILAAAANLQAAGATVGIATANLYPSININGNYFFESLTPGALFKVANAAWGFAANLSAPIFNAGMLKAEKRKAQQAYQGIMAQYQKTILNAFKDVANALTALANDATAVDNAADSLLISQTDLELAYTQRKIGSAGLLQILDKQRKLATSEIALIRAQSQRYTDTAKLFVVLGGSPIAIMN